MRAVAVVPAKHRSLRFLGKHNRMVGARSLVGWALHMAEQAQRIGLVQDIVAVTDTAWVPDYFQALPKGAGCLNQPERTALGVGATLRWLLVESRRDKLSPDPIPCPWDIALVLYPTSPLRTLRHLVESRLLLEEGWDGVLSVAPYRQDPWWAVTAEDEIAPVSLLTSAGYSMPDCAPALWKSDGTALWVRTGAFLDRAKPPLWFYGLRLRPYRMDRMESVDVDHEDDLLLAEALLTRRGGP